MLRSTLWGLALAVAAGCSVPPTRLEHDVRNVEKLRGEMVSALQNERFDAALVAADEVTKLGDEIAAKILMGDPRRERVDSALARAREIRKEIGLRKERRAGSEHGRLVERMAMTALDEGKASKEEVKGPPAGVDVSGLLAPVTGPAGKSSGEGGDVDLDRHRKLVRGDREGDVTDDILKRPGREGRPDGTRPGKLRIDEGTPPIVIHPKIVRKGKGVAAYFTFVNKSPDVVRIGSVTGSFLRETGKAVASIIITYEAKGFQPNWERIFDSKGKAVTGSSHAVQPKEGLGMVCVCEKPKVGRITQIKIVVTTTDGRRHRATGPKP